MATLTAHPQHTPDTSPDIKPQSDAVLDTISAYYSLVFPDFTYYLQTLNVTIGRRCIPSSAASSSDNPQVDVDLGPLKSVSRLHAKIEYEEEEERFVLIVLGRNGAWVDGVWSGSGSKVPLGERSQIQIASRTFQFILPPPPAPEDSPSPSSQSSGNRPRSPSVDITSLSPPSSLPSCSPPPTAIAPVPPKIPPRPEPSLPNSNSIVRQKINSKKRKKSDVDPSPPLPPPGVVPAKPQLTYAKLCYRAIKALGGRASLQDICTWIQDTFEWYKYCGKDWESSVRHNLSSNRAFKKIDRGPEEKGKGALWSVDEQFEHTFEDQDMKKPVSGPFTSAPARDVKIGIKKGKSTATLEPALKRSVKGDAKGAPLPPPLTNTPLVLKTASNNTQNQPVTSRASTLYPISTSNVKVESSPIHLSPQPPPQAGAPPVSAFAAGNAAPSTATTAASQPASSLTAIPSSVRLPIIVGPVPASHASSAEPKPIVLHENTLILNPEIFSHLTQQQIRDLEALGAQKALEILQSYIVRFYKEKLKAEGARGRGRGKPRRGRGGPAGRVAASGPSERADGPSPNSFITAPPHHPQAPPALAAGGAGGVTGPLMSGSPPMGSLKQEPDSAPSPIVIIDDDSPDEGAALKRRRVDHNDFTIV